MANLCLFSIIQNSDFAYGDIFFQAFQYSLEQKLPLMGFSGDRIVTLFDHPLIENLHTFYMEPKVLVHIDCPCLFEYLAYSLSCMFFMFSMHMQGWTDFMCQTCDCILAPFINKFFLCALLFVL